MTSRRSGVPASAPRISADETSTLKTLGQLWPYIWPSDRPDLKSRVGLA